MTFSRFLYTVSFYLLSPIIVLRLLYRALKAPAYARRWAERWGFVTAPMVNNIIWLHAVSVGETLAATPLVKELQQRFPNHRLMVTCMTPTGSERIKAAFGDTVDHSYAPYDMPDAVGRFLGRVTPSALIIMETELWPNTIAACSRRSIPVILANGRLSEKSARAYCKIGSLVGPMLRSMSAVVAQHRDDGNRFVELGLPAEALSISGNIKFDLDLDAAVQGKAQLLGAEWRGDKQRPILLAASTHQGEDELILQAFAQIKGALTKAPLLVLVPRHPERFNSVAQLCHDGGFALARRSAEEATAQADILLGDTMGELMAFFGACDIAFVGGSLVSSGGHNIIEPAAWGVPVLTGPHLFNFAEASRLLIEGGAMSVCGSAERLAEQAIGLFENQQRRTEMGDAARLIADANRGALERLMAVIDRHLS
ncbi:MAG: lipid IV(A) 3-deoxy-D-manno-octulosonic acid transferase [Porticoccaceae bacterium]|jgi:3-deoxy-D-manno-octulosonic-acid transferase|nr:lipid IV(A) 3-deoxy-D-manno-octulosonic acid transferase [Porticoccaceae bacterium]